MEGWAWVRGEGGGARRVGHCRHEGGAVGWARDDGMSERRWNE